MSLLDILSQQSVWNSFYEYKLSLACPKQFTRELRSFIDEEHYLPVCEAIRTGAGFPLPSKSVISKMGSEKKRIVYTYPKDENTVLKLLTYLMLRQYDGLFADGLYSFRPRRTAQDAVRRLLKINDLHQMFSYKADIHDYFNSVHIEMLLPMLRSALSDDEKLYSFLAVLLSESRVIDRGTVIQEQKGIMAGTPLSAFYANLFLSGLDKYFADNRVIYARYSDDIILFAPTKEEAMSHAAYIRSFLEERSLAVNPLKECFSEPEEGFTFLGFSCIGNQTDIAPATLKKLKQKMRRKRDALLRWKKRSGADSERAAKAFIRIFNRKLLESPRDNELSWSSWFFPTITTTQSLHIIDLYAQDCLRCLISGKHTKARYNVRYQELKALGYRSLVNAYYSYNKITDKSGTD